MYHNPALLTQWLIPTLYLLNSCAQRVQILRIMNASCAEGCKNLPSANSVDTDALNLL